MQHTGGLAFSRFHTDKLLRAAQAEVPKLTGLTSHHVHFVEFSAEPDAADTEVLLKLLDYPPADREEFFQSVKAACQVLVVPRSGTISPWSSKATDIAHNCGLDKVARVERGVLWTLLSTDSLDEAEVAAVAHFLHDRMTEDWNPSLREIEQTLFQHTATRPLRRVPLLERGLEALTEANKNLGLALSAEEVGYLHQQFKELGRDPTDVELMMFAQANSEHCRHKIFNASWVIDKQTQHHSLFGMIRNTHAKNPGKVLAAYHDNAAIMAGFDAEDLVPLEGGVYTYRLEERPILMKVETHNHPTAISPFPGAATGSGGEIRDEAATGRGSKAKAGLTGFSVSNLRIPGALQPWEDDYGKPERIASALDIMIHGPLGGSAFNNEFGRPNLCGYFRSFELTVNGQRRGYHKPIMLAGGVGHVRPTNMQKKPLPVGAKLVVLGGPAMLIGLGGGAASSMSSGHSDAELDFASVQRGNPEVERRCQEVIDACTRLGAKNPIYSIHDVGAGGLSNALPELLNDGGCGGRVELRRIPSADPALSPMEIWCNEAQERYVLALAEADLPMFAEVCERERCPWAVVGETIADKHLVLTDSQTSSVPIDLPLRVFLGHPVHMLRNVIHLPQPGQALSAELQQADWVDAALRVLRHPTVAGKNFLITIGDRSITGLVVRDQMVGPWQVPVADCAVTRSGFRAHTGEAMAIGERPPLALLNPAASGRMAVAEALTNLAAAPVDDLSDIVLSANWMAACGHPGEDAALFDTVRAVGLELCPALGIAIPVGKDSLSMKTVWQQAGAARAVTSPLSLIVSAFARVADIHRCLTPQIQRVEDSVLLLIDLGKRKNRMGGSVLANVYGQIGDVPPDLDKPEDLKAFFKAIQSLNQQGKLLAYHDRADGGLLATLCEMAFAGHCGLDISLDKLGPNPLHSLFSEELGAVVQVRRADLDSVTLHFVANANLSGHVSVIGQPNDNQIISVQHQKRTLLALSRTELQRAWAETSYHLQRLRDNPECAKQEYDGLLDTDDPGLSLRAGFELSAPAVGGARPRIAVLREQGVNGQIEMAAAFDRAGFEAVDVHMSDLISGRLSLTDFKGLVACGGFSYGDVLGAGGGWAKSIRFNPRAFEQFSAFFQRADSFALGVCNGCQMLSQLHDLIPGADNWPRFVRNRSEQFEARLVTVEVLESPSLFLRGMAGARLPIAVAHGEGRAEFSHPQQAQALLDAGLVGLRYVDNRGQPTQVYPANPNGSPLGITGLTTPDGRFSVMMPHPERVFLRSQYSYLPPGWDDPEHGPWLQLFHNARRWLG